MVSHKDIRKLISDILTEIGLWSIESQRLVLGTGAVETHYIYIRQIQGPARSFWQVEPKTAISIFKDHLLYRPQRIDLIAQTCMIPKGFVQSTNEDKIGFMLERNIAFAICMCRLKYRMIPHPLPGADDIPGQAEYWNDFYNVNPDHGFPKDYIEAQKILD